MTGYVRRGSAIGLCLLPLGLLSPLTVVADTPAPKTEVSSSAFAAPSTPSSAVPSDFGLTVSPTPLVIGQNDATVQKIQVMNTGRVAQAITVQKRNFTAGIDGALNFQENAPYSAAEWITVAPASVEIAPGVTQLVTATIAVPAQPEPGDHQVALVFLVAAGQGSGNIAVNRGIGIPAYITVPGPTDDSATISSLTAPGFAMSGPVALTATVHNTGTVHRDFRGDTPLRIDAADGLTQFPEFTVPRDSDRNVIGTWDPPLIGVFHPTATFTNADGGVQTASVRVVVFPVVPAMILVGALMMLGLLILIARRGYRTSVTRTAALQAIASSGHG